MKMGARRFTLLASLLLCACGTNNVGLPWEGPGPFGSGDEGDVDVGPTDERLVSACFPLEETLTDAIVVRDWVMQPEHRQLLLVQLQGAAATSGDQNLIPAGALGQIGQWEIVTVQGQPADGETTIPLSDPVRNVYVSDDTGWRATACTVRELDNVTVAAGGILRARPWNGESGGVVAMRVAGTLHIDGTISASGAGFRGGIVRVDNNIAPSVELSDLDTANDGSAGGKGEGCDGRSYDGSGRGNMAIAGGGGNAHNGGGGGGALIGAGGYGGKQYPGGQYQYDNDLQRGMPGAPVEPGNWMFFGGAGGAGHQNEGVGGAGGNAGGILFILAARLEGSGLIESNGLAGTDSGHDPVNDDPDGAGGGGAGGWIRLHAGDTDFSGLISAAGGGGGNIDEWNQPVPKGPGGGGGGGLIDVTGFAPANTDVAGGAAGLYDDGAGTIINWGTTAGADGTVLLH